MDAGERQALISLFNATGGDSWHIKKGWCTNAPLGEWFGVVTNDQDSVVKLTLVENNLEGVIPAEIGELKNLQVLKLYVNKLNGVIPAEIGELKNLQVLKLYVNKLNGVIPVEIGELKNLQVLYLNFNKLNGSIPKELGLLIKLKTIWLNNNKLTGAIPKELGELKGLRDLYLQDNQLSGAIPKEFGELKDLQHLYLSNNQLSGAIPMELGELKNLQRLDLSNNQLSDFGGVNEAQRLLSKFEGVNFTGGQSIDLRGNPWIMPPESVVEKGLTAVRSYYEDVRVAIDAGAEVITRNLLKVVLVGSPSAGKTSLMKSIISGHANRTKGTPEEASTEGIELQPHKLGDTSVEFYDCAGQVDYGGMHQVFLTRRALFLLVWDITRCYAPSGNDLDEEIRDMIMRWLYTLHLRAPGATVILVANKCDEAIDDVKKTTQMVEERVDIMLQEWKDRRWLNTLKEVNLLSRSISVSCQNYIGIPDVLDRIEQQGATKIYVPPAWELALNVIDCLRCKRSPMDTARERLGLPVTTTSIGSKQSGPFVSKQELSDIWRGIVEGVGDEVHGTINQVAVCNPESALEGAIWIREFAGQILLVEDGNGIFLDVGWLSDLLTPILSHKLGGRSFPTALCALQDDLVHGKILRWEFARHLWREVLDHSAVQSSESVGNALYRVLVKLGVAIPLRQIHGETASLASQEDNQPTPPPPDMLVIMRLRETCGEGQQRLLKKHTDDALTTGVRDVTLKWEFDSAGCPYGLMERLIASCHVVGVVEYRLCWRYGALFRSLEMARRFGQNVRLYTMIIRYDKTRDDLDENLAHALTVQMIGALENPRVWTALRFVASAVVTLSKEWPGVIVKGSPLCPRHPLNPTAVYMIKPDEARIGGPLILEGAPGARSTGCDCHLASNEIVGLVIDQLGLVIDIKKDPFERLVDHESRVRKGLFEMFIIWRPNARQTAVGLWGLALVFFGGILTGVVEEVHTLWQVCLAIMVLSLVGAVFASVVHYQDVRHRAARHGVGPSAD